MTHVLAAAVESPEKQLHVHCFVAGVGRRRRRRRPVAFPTRRPEAEDRINRRLPAPIVRNALELPDVRKPPIVIAREDQVFAVGESIAPGVLSRGRVLLPRLMMEISAHRTQYHSVCGYAQKDLGSLAKSHLHGTSCAPVNASPAPSRVPAHDSGSPWLAGPSV
jgi:hypothetical protein